MLYLSVVDLVSMMLFNSKVMLTNNTDYSCHIKVLELFEPILIMQFISCQIMVLVINNLGEDTHAQTHAHTQTHTHTYTPTSWTEETSYMPGLINHVASYKM